MLQYTIHWGWNSPTPNGIGSNPYSPGPHRQAQSVAVDPNVILALCWMASYGCFAREPLGRTCLNAIRPIKHASGAPSNGCGRACSSASSTSWPKTSMSVAESTSARHLSRDLRFAKKRGPCGREYEAWKRRQDHGSCRRCWSSYRRSRGERFAPRSDAGGRNLRPPLC